jgi:hypothetical protein
METFRRLKTERLRRSDQVRWAPAWLARNPAMARRCDPRWDIITEQGWLGFQHTRADDWDQYEFRRKSGAQ